MFGSSLRAGFGHLKARPGLSVLLYAFNLGLAALLAVPVFIILSGEFADSGFSADFARQFDLVLLWDALESAGPALRAVLRQALWAIPLILLWKVAASVGLIHALSGDGRGAFWTGVGRYTLRAFVLALLYLIPLLLLIGLVSMVIGMVAEGQGEVGAFWTQGVVWPTLVITLVAIVDLMHDYGRMHLVLNANTIRQSWWYGVKWPFVHGTASWIYTSWFVLAAALWFLPFVLDTNLAAATAGGMWGLLLLQQATLFFRSAATVGWMGSEVAFFEARGPLAPVLHPLDAPLEPVHTPYFDPHTPFPGTAPGTDPVA